MESSLFKAIATNNKWVFTQLVPNKGQLNAIDSNFTLRM